MNVELKRPPTIVRTERGLTIGGTRLTLYQLLDHLKAGQSPRYVRDFYHLTIKQMEDVMAYIEQNRETVELEYQQVLAQAEENRRYWEERNRERFEQIRKLPPKSEHAEIWKRLQERKARRAATESKR